MKQPNRTQIRVDDDRVEMARKVQARILHKTGRNLSLTLVLSMAVGIGLPHVEKAFIHKK